MLLLNNSEYSDPEPFHSCVTIYKLLVIACLFFGTPGVRILLDFVPNHSSDEHEWFQKSVQKIDPYTDYYVWLDGKVDENGNKVPPNNWVNKIISINLEN